MLKYMENDIIIRTTGMDFLVAKLFIFMQYGQARQEGSDDLRDEVNYDLSRCSISGILIPCLFCTI